MTVVGGGGLVVSKLTFKPRFKREFAKLNAELVALCNSKFEDLLANPRPPGLRFEKLKGYKNPDIYTVHLTGNYKVSMEIEGSLGILRRVANHDDIDRSP